MTLSTLESPSPDEEAITQAFIDLISQHLREKYPQSPIKRFAHPRTVGLLEATFTVLPDLAADLRVGIFAEPRSYQAWIRFGNNAFESDAEKDIRGMSIKLPDVEEETLLGNGQAQDFILISHPVLVAGTPRSFLKMQQALIAGSPIKFFLNPFDLHLREMREALKARQHHTSHFDIRYWSTTPYAFGDGRAVKYGVRPTSAIQSRLPEALTPTYLEEALGKHLAQGEATFDFMVQFQTDSKRMPIENALVRWDEKESPFVPVARIRIPKQDYNTPDRLVQAEKMAFNPWNAVAAQRPLGGINRVRREVYTAMARLRHQSRNPST